MNPYCTASRLIVLLFLISFKLTYNSISANENTTAQSLVVSLTQNMPNSTIEMNMEDRQEFILIHSK